MLYANSNSINSDVVMIGGNPIDYYESNDNMTPTPSTEYVEEMINFLEKQSETILESYKNIFTNNYNTENTNPTVVYEIHIPSSPIIVYRSCGFCIIVLLFVVATIVSTILLSCKKNKKSVNIVKAEPLTVKPIEIKSINV